MRPTELTKYLAFAIENKFPVLVKGRPGAGKTDIMKQAAKDANAELIISHPVVSDPTDYKGLPFPGKDNTADFLPYGDLSKILKAKKKTIFFLDDLGQAPASVQAACMQLILAREINGKKVSEQVIFMAATNRKEDKAGVSGILSPVKSRFVSIIELEVLTEDWIAWAFANDMPTELIAFVRFKPNILEEYKPVNDMVNIPSPRTITAIGRQQNANLSKELEFEVFKGAAGEAFSQEYCTFLKMHRELPSIDDIILNPSKAVVPKNPGALLALSAGMARKISDQTIGPIYTYLERLPKENSVACMKDAASRDSNITKNRVFIKWAEKYGNMNFKN